MELIGEPSMLLYLMTGFNLILMAYLMYKVWYDTRKHHYGIIINKEGEAVCSFKLDPSNNKHKHSHGGKDYSYIHPEDYNGIKHRNNRYYFWEFNKTEPLKFQSYDTTMYADVFDELLLMSKIKALNEVKKGLFGSIDRKWILIGLVVVVALFVFGGKLFGGG